MIGKFLWDVKYSKDSPKRALSFETEARDHLAPMALCEASL
jgi:hypothetical protein